MTDENPIKKSAGAIGDCLDKDESMEAFPFLSGHKTTFIEAASMRR
jgi:hypothetical protein